MSSKSSICFTPKELISFTRVFKREYIDSAFSSSSCLKLLSLSMRTRGYISLFGLPQRRPYIHVVEALTKSIASRQLSLFREHNHGHLDPDLHEGRLPTKEGSPSPAQSCRHRSTPSRRVVDLPASHQSSKDGRRTKIQFWFTLEPQHKDLNLA